MPALGVFFQVIASVVFTFTARMLFPLIAEPLSMHAAAIETAKILPKNNMEVIKDRL